MNRLSARHLALSTLAMAAHLCAHGQARPSASAASSADLADVIVTGTRSVGTKVTQSLSPVAIVTSQQLEQTGQRNIIDALTRLEPSLTALARGGDFANIVRSASLRGLGPNQTLVLVNGKRRHTTAYIASGGVTAGAAAVDLDQIPFSAIERIEILKDGASAQYGSDAIAGVLNIILKNSTHEGSIDVTYGIDADSKINPDGLGNGRTRSVGISKGFKLDAGGFLDISVDARDKLHTNQTGPELRTTTVDPFISKISGDPAYSLGAAAFNAGYSIAGDVQLYAFGTYGKRRAESHQNYRLPSAFPLLTAVGIYPQGFGPIETSHERDHSLTAGVKGGFWGDGRWDLSVVTGGDSIDLGLTQTVNYDLFKDTGKSPLAVDIGNFSNRQTTVNLDLGKPVSVAWLAEPLQVAAGLEGRQERYSIQAGDFASSYKGGSQAFVGLTPFDAGSHSRNVVGAYGDVTARIATDWQLAAALRSERYNDFGSTTTGKLSARWDATKAFALRSTLSNGYRAPNLAEQYYSATNVSPTTTSVQLPANSVAAKLAGASALKPEKSTNLSFGLVATPYPGLRLTADAYRIVIKDRIVLASGITGAAADAAIAANGITIQTAPGTGRVAYFANGIDTRTTGLDLTAQLSTDLDAIGFVKWSLAANFKTTKVTRALAIFTPPVLSNLTDPTPKNKIVATADWSRGPLSSTLRVTHYGSASLLSTDGRTGAAPYYRSTVGAAFITDLEAGYEFIEGPRLSIGANNLFNKFPNQVALETILPTGGGRLPGWSPYGYNGAFYYANANWKF